jgi:hypothetical protein
MKKPFQLDPCNPAFIRGVAHTILYHRRALYCADGLSSFRINAIRQETLDPIKRVAHIPPSPLPRETECLREWVRVIHFLIAHKRHNWHSLLPNWHVWAPMILDQSTDTARRTALEWGQIRMIADQASDLPRPERVLSPAYEEYPAVWAPPEVRTPLPPPQPTPGGPTGTSTTHSRSGIRGHFLNGS